MNEEQKECPICKRVLNRRVAFFSVESDKGNDFRLARAVEDKKGYDIISDMVFAERKSADRFASELNEAFKLSKDDVAQIIGSTMKK